MTFLIFLGVLSLLVFVHEAGHFLVAKKAGIRVEEFGFGIPHRIIGKKIGDTIYSLNLLPIGGFVRLLGEDREEVSESDRLGLTREELKKRAFFTQPKRIRIAVVVAGVIMNFLLGVVLFSGLYTAIGIPTAADGVQIVELFKDSPGASAFELGDEVVSVEGTAVQTPQEFQDLVQGKSGQEVGFEVLRGGALTIITALARSEPPVHYGAPTLQLSDDKRGIACVRQANQEGALGVVISSKTEMMHYPIWQMPFRAAGFGLKVAYGWGSNIIRGLGGLLTQLVCGSVPQDIGGPVEIAFLISEVSKAGFAPLINLVAVLSINLAIVNLLPIPALDGGRLLFIVMEAVIGRTISARAERLTHAVGMALLLALMFAITVQDILRRSGAESLGALVERVIRM